MDFSNALQMLEAVFDDLEAPWAVIGGLALMARGAGRMTRDLDIVTVHRIQDGLVSRLEAGGYETLHRSRGYSNHFHPDSDLGRLDFVYVEGDTARSLFEEAERLEILPGITGLVPRAEHLIAMKVLAMKNDPTRRIQEMADILSLMRAQVITAESVREHFERFGLRDDWEEIRESL